MVGRLQVLVACSDPESRRILLTLLAHCGFEPLSSSTVREARAMLFEQPVSLVICSTDLADGNFRDILQAAGASAARTPVVVASRSDDTSEYLEAMRLGAFDFIACPYRQSEVEWIVGRALQRAAVVAA